MIHKKAVSPLIAWILLVGFTVALGTFVANWAIEQAKQFEPGPEAYNEIYCAETAISICKKESLLLSLNTFLTNKGVYTINKILFRGGNKYESGELKIQPGETSEITTEIGEWIGENHNINKVEVIPFIIVDKDIYSCPNKAFLLEIDKIPICQE